MWTAIHNHGPLPTHYLHAFTDKDDYKNHQNRLTKHRYGTEGNGPFIVRCSIAVEDPLTATNVYKLHRNAENELSQRGIYSKHSTRRGWDVHQLMGSCVTASIQLAAKDITFIPRHIILSANNKPLKLPLGGDKFLVPDELFGLDYGTVSKYFVCEWDRNSEPWERKTSTGKRIYFKEKLLDYITLIEAGGLQKDTRVLIVTTSKARAQSIKELLQDTEKAIANRFLINVLDYFDDPWKMPPILDGVFEWQRADGSTFDISRA